MFNHLPHLVRISSPTKNHLIGRRRSGKINRRKNKQEKNLKSIKIREIKPKKRGKMGGEKTKKLIHDEKLTLEEINRKLDALVNEQGKPKNINEFISWHTIIILVIIGIVTAIWSDLIMKKFGLKEGKNMGVTVVISIVGIVAVILLALSINAE